MISTASSSRALRVSSVQDDPRQPGRTMLNMTWMQGCTKTRYAGIFKTKSGYRVRVRAMDPRTGTLREANREYEGIDLREALLQQTQMRDEITSGGVAAQRLRVGEFAKHWIESKGP